MKLRTDARSWTSRDVHVWPGAVIRPTNTSATRGPAIFGLLLRVDLILSAVACMDALDEKQLFPRVDVDIAAMFTPQFPDPLEASMSSKSQAVIIRAAEPSDAARVGQICFDAFKSIADHHRFPPDFPSPGTATELLGAFISNPNVYGVVAEEGGIVVGSNFLWGTTVGGIGPITIAPDRQNAGVGRRLMEAVLDRAAAEGMASVRLVQAGYHTRSLALYASMGFACREPLVVMQGRPFLQQIPGHAVREANAADADGATALCQRVHGHGRRTEFMDGVSQGTARVVEFNGRLVAYTAGLAFFGHSVAETSEGLKALVGSGEPFGGPGILVPSRSHEVFRWALAKGLRVVQPMTLMTTGLYGEPQGAYLPSVLY